MRVLSSIVAASALLTGLASASPIALAANVPPHVQGQNCAVVAAKIGKAKTWQASYWGWRVDIFERHTEQFLQSPCFTTQASCKAWLYWAQTDYPNEIVMKFCKKGQPYG
jgi:hypothetical protein